MPIVRMASMTARGRLAADQQAYQDAIERWRLDPHAPHADEDVERAYKALWESWAEHRLGESA